MRTQYLALHALLFFGVLCSTLAEPVRANGGAVISFGVIDARIPLLTVPQADSGDLVLYHDYSEAPAGVYAQRLDPTGKPLLGEGVRVAADANPVVLPDGVGGAIVATSDNRGATGRDIVLRRINPDGTHAYGPNGIVICDAALDQDTPRLIAESAGSYYVAWLDRRANAAAADIYAQRVSLAGTPLWAANGTLVNITADRSYSLLAVPDFAGGLICTWYPSSGSASRAQRLNSSGTRLWTTNGVTYGATTRGSPRPPRTAREDSGPSTRSGTAPTRVWSCINCNPLAHPFASAGVEFAAVYQGSVVPAFMRNTSGGCTAYVWYDNWGSVNSSEIYRQEITSAGLLPLGLQGALVARSDNVPTLVESSGSVLLGIVEKALGRVGSRLRVQRLGFDGTPHYAGTGIIVGPPTPIREMTAPSLSMAADGMIVAAWVDGRYRRPTDSLRYQIFGQAVTSTGAALWDDAELPVIHQSPTRPAIRVGSRG